MEYSHVPVLLKEAIYGLRIKKDGIYVDATVGGGGHSEAILRELGKEGLLIGLDQDDSAIKSTTARLANEKFEASYELYNENFENLDIILKKKHIQAVDGILLDIGVSSFQLDNPERGFSYRFDAALDMRMDEGQKISAWDIVNKYPEETLKKIFYEYAEERWSARIADFIIKARKVKSIDTTFELAGVIKSAIPKGARREGPHPARRTFQALRIAVNDELGVLQRTLDKAPDMLNPGGRLAVITFHSLEDRIVKRAFARYENPCECPKQLPMCVCGKKATAFAITRKPIISTVEELENNPRAESAKLRIVEKI